MTGAPKACPRTGRSKASVPLKAIVVDKRSTVSIGIAVELTILVRYVCCRSVGFRETRRGLVVFSTLKSEATTF